MPIYEYACDDCHEVTEALRRMDDADAPIRCEHCGGEHTRRVQSVFAAVRSAAEAPAPRSCGRCGDPRGSCGM